SPSRSLSTTVARDPGGTRSRPFRAHAARRFATSRVRPERSYQQGPDLTTWRRLTPGARASGQADRFDGSKSGHPGHATAVAVAARMGENFLDRYRERWSRFLPYRDAFRPIPAHDHNPAAVR